MLKQAFYQYHPVLSSPILQGLVIPDGGVHIVGGDNGDAFIAFATDEDARRAMQMTGKELHGKPVK